MNPTSRLSRIAHRELSHPTDQRQSKRWRIRWPVPLEERSQVQKMLFYSCLVQLRSSLKRGRIAHRKLSHPRIASRKLAHPNLAL